MGYAACACCVVVPHETKVGFTFDILIIRMEKRLIVKLCAMRMNIMCIHMGPCHFSGEILYFICVCVASCDTRTDKPPSNRIPPKSQKHSSFLISQFNVSSCFATWIFIRVYGREGTGPHRKQPQRMSGYYVN